LKKNKIDDISIIDNINNNIDNNEIIKPKKIKIKKKIKSSNKTENYNVFLFDPKLSNQNNIIIRKINIAKKIDNIFMIEKINK
jgi:hypothetical protein